MCDVLTTIYINKDLLATLDSTARDLQMSRGLIATKLMELYVRHHFGKAAKFHAVKYQDADPDGDWTRGHVSLEGGVYEEFIDFRKIFKRSVSFMISYALLNYLEELGKQIKLKMDNCLMTYQLLTTKSINSYNFQVKWNIPPPKTP